MATSQPPTPLKPGELTLDYGNMSIEEVYAMAREFAKGKLHLCTA